MKRTGNGLRSFIPLQKDRFNLAFLLDLFMSRSCDSVWARFCQFDKRNGTMKKSPTLLDFDPGRQIQ